MPQTILTQEMATIRHFATSGDKMADAIVKLYDALRADAKEQVIVRAATTANITLSAPQTVDGIVLVAGDLVLCKDQTDDTTRGIYVVQAGAWTRLLNYNGDYVLAPGMAIVVRLGTTLNGTQWLCTATGVVVGTDHITFAQMIGAVAPGAIGTTALANLGVTAGKLAAAVAVDIAGTPSASVAAENEGTETIVVTLQLKDVTGTALAAAARATVWISDTAGAAPSASPPAGHVTISTGTLLKQVTTDVLFDVVSNASGVIGVSLVSATAATWFVNVAIGSLVVSSAAVTFDA